MKYSDYKYKVKQSYTIYILKDDKLVQKDIREISQKRCKNFYVSLYNFRRKNYIICQRCREHKAFHIHHIDKDRSNNSLENMIILCKVCHELLHHPSNRRFNHSYH